MTAERLIVGREAAQAPLRDAAKAHVKASQRVAGAVAALAAVPTASPRLGAALAAKAAAIAAVVQKSAEPGCAANCRALLQAQVDAARAEVTQARGEIANRGTAAESELAAAPLSTLARRTTCRNTFRRKCPMPSTSALKAAASVRTPVAATWPGNAPSPASDSGVSIRDNVPESDYALRGVAVCDECSRRSASYARQEAWRRPRSVGGSLDGGLKSTERYPGALPGAYPMSEDDLPSSGGCSRIRTYDPLIKSQLLYQLSYAPAPLTTASSRTRPRWLGSSRWGHDGKRARHASPCRGSV